ncbi:hypothetical protein AT959_03685 [Dechloromonas denitrificans]|uniref:Uncharacterized protein n=1 Tax=Dechloromonas denitrificans TaxID=281362 RepID=A0A133XML2_9RHOO|nr:hypothetical protein AT959_03685 [Dechloromonas denitrificans]
MRVATSELAVEPLVAADMICRPPTVMPFTTVELLPDTVIVEIRGAGMRGYMFDESQVARHVVRLAVEHQRMEAGYG